MPLQWLNIVGSNVPGAPIATLDTDQGSLKLNEPYRLIQAGEHDITVKGAAPSASPSYNTGAIQESVNEWIAAPRGAQLKFPAGIYHIDNEIDIGLALYKDILGSGYFGTKIIQDTNDKAIFNFTADGTSYGSLKNFDLAWAEYQESDKTNAYGIAVSIPGTTTQGLFGYTFDRLRTTGAARGLGIRKASGSATMWDLHFGHCVFLDSSLNAIYINNPSTVGQPESTFNRIYCQNSSIVSGGAALDIEGVELAGNILGIEDWENDAISISSSKEQFRVANLHVERHLFNVANARILRVSSTGYVQIGDFGFDGTINVSDAYLLTPGGGTVKIDSLYTGVTNTSGNLSIVASGSGRVSIGYHKEVSGTIGLRPSWDAGAAALITDYNGRHSGGITHVGTIANSATISAVTEQITVTNAGAVTGIILAAGLVDGETKTIINLGSGSVTFATDATSRVAGGTGVAIAATGAASKKTFTWVTSTGRWYAN